MNGYTEPDDKVSASATGAVAASARMASFLALDRRANQNVHKASPPVMEYPTTGLTIRYCLIERLKTSAVAMATSTMRPDAPHHGHDHHGAFEQRIGSKADHPFSLRR